MVLDSGNSTVAASGASPSSASRLLDWRVALVDVPKLPDCLGAPVDECTIVHGARGRVLLVGDSHARMWIPTFVQIARRESLTLSVAALPGCPWQRGVVYTGDVFLTPEQRRSCLRHQADWYDRLVPQLRPDVIFLVHKGYDDPRFSLRLVFSDEHALGVGDAGYEQALADASSATLRALAHRGRKLVIIEPVPLSGAFNPLTCLSTGRRPGRCAFTAEPGPTPLERFYRRESDDKTMWSLDLDRLVCPRLPICDAVVGNVIVRRDSSGHLTATYARAVAGDIDRMLGAARILNRR